MKRSLLLAPVIALAAGFLASPAAAITPTGFDCGPDDGRGRLTAEGFHLDFQAPGTTATGHDLISFAGQEPPPAVMQHSTAHFPFRLFTAPSTFATVKVGIDWEGTGDFDLDVLDDEGEVLGGSHAFNPVDGNGETVTVADVAHCTDLWILVNNYLASPEEMLTLDIQVTPGDFTFACEADDPHPACAGKAEGEAPATAADPRARLYLGGDRPGQASMAGHYAGGTAGQPEPLTATLETGRPTGGQTNSFTHTALGFTDQGHNPFHAHFTAPVAEPFTLQGDVHALVWVSSQTLQDGGTLHVDLWADSFGQAASGTRLARVDVAGKAIGTAPTPLAVTFQDLDVFVEQELFLQISSEPVATSGGQTGNPADAHWTVYYDSVQFPSQLALEVPAGALATPAE